VRQRCFFDIFKSVDIHATPLAGVRFIARYVHASIQAAVVQPVIITRVYAQLSPPRATPALIAELVKNGEGRDVSQRKDA